MLGILIHSSVGWNFAHIFCYLLCTFFWHKHRNVTHTNTHAQTHKRMGEASCTAQHCYSLALSHTHAHTRNHICSDIHRWIQQRAPTRGTDNTHTCARTHTHINQLLLLYPTNLGDQRLINKSSILEEVTEQRNADMDSRQYWISLYHDPLVFAAQLW